MYNLDDNFLTEIGIIDMPEPARGKLVEGIQQTINNRIGLELGDELTDFLVDELTQINNSPEFAKKWLEANIPHYVGTSEFSQFSQLISREGADVTQLYAQSKWFEKHLPTLPIVTERVVNEVMQEIKAINGML